MNSFKNIFNEKDRVEEEFVLLNEKVIDKGIGVVDFNKEQELKAKLAELMKREEIF